MKYRIPFLLLSFLGLLLAACTADQHEFNPTASEVTSFVDTRDSNSYRCVKIGHQVWMAENLRYRLPLGGYDGCLSYDEQLIDPSRIAIDKEVFADSLREAVAQGEVPAEDVSYFTQLFLSPRSQGYDMSLSVFLKSFVDENSTETYASFFASIVPTIQRINQHLLNLGLQAVAQSSTNRDYVAQYGYLYTYAAAQKAVPEGWRLPTDEDWKTLEQALGMNIAEAERMEQWRGTNQGDLLLHSALLGFDVPLAGALPFGAINGFARTRYINKDIKAYYWTSSSVDPIDSTEVAIIRALQYNDKRVYRGTSFRTDRLTGSDIAYSVRCVRND